MKRRVIPRGVQFRRCCDVRSAAVVVLFDIFDPQNLSAVTEVRVEFIVHPRKRRGGTKSLPFECDIILNRAGLFFFVQGRQRKDNSVPKAQI